MYLQITTKCNMTCEHCCFACTKYGRHGDLSTIKTAMSLIAEYKGNLTLGGGEPTLHPDFFEILEYGLLMFDNVWFATNGSQTEKMYRIHNIINDCDYDLVECNCSDEDKDNGYCECYNNCIMSNGKLSVDLSQDIFHDSIDNRIVELWSKMKESKRYSNYGIRNTYKNGKLINSGRAKQNNLGTDSRCTCDDIFIKPNGNIFLCGCKNSPKIGDVWNGIEGKWWSIWEDYDNFKYGEEKCFKNIKRGLLI